MKFLNFFKTGLGIFIIILVVVAIIVISMNWTTIKTWWNTPSAATPGTNNATPTSNDGASDTTNTGGRTSNPLLNLGSAERANVCVEFGDGRGCTYNGLYVACTECSKRGIKIIS